MTPEQINYLMEFIRQNMDCDSFCISMLNTQTGQVKMSFQANSLQMSFMSKVIDSAILKMLTLPPAPPPGSGKTNLVSVV